MTSNKYTNVILILILLTLLRASFQLTEMNKNLRYVEANMGMVQKLLAK